MFVLAVIPARKGSKRCPGKNTRLLDGKPLVLWTIEAAKQSELLTYVLGTTDDERVMAIFANNGVSYICRPDELATDTASIYDVIFHAVERSGMKPQYVCLLQPTSPFRTAEQIDEVLRQVEDCAYTVNENGEPNGGVYVAKLDYLKEHKTFAGGKKILQPQWVDVDTEDDFKRAEEYANSQQ